MWAILSCWFFTFTFMYKSKSNLWVSSYFSVNGTNFIQKSETGGKWTEEIRSLQNRRKHWRCVLGPGSWSWSLESQRVQGPEQWVIHKRTRQPCWQPLTSAVCGSHALPSSLCLPELVQVPPLSQSRKCAFQASCPGLKGSRHVSEMLTSSSNNCCWIRILIGRWESGGNFTCCLLFSSLFSHPTGKHDRGPMNRSDVMLISKPSLQWIDKELAVKLQIPQEQNKERFILECQHPCWEQ